VVEARQKAWGRLLQHTEQIFIYTVSQKNQATAIFLNNSVKHWQILIIFGTQHHD